MEQQADDVLAMVKNHNLSMENKIKAITDLKAQIKHRQVPDAAVSPTFEVIRIGIATPSLLDAAFATLSHLIKRLTLQDQQHILSSQGNKTYPLILERLGDQKDRVRLRASNALTDFWTVSPSDVEQLVRDMVLSGKNPRAKEAGMQWVSKVVSKDTLLS